MVKVTMNVDSELWKLLHHDAAEKRTKLKDIIQHVLIKYLEGEGWKYEVPDTHKHMFEYSSELDDKIEYECDCGKKITTKKE